MKKYDCLKTQDCIHEYHRVCTSYPAGCESSCPFFEIDVCGLDMFGSEDMIALLQKWSDEHPEKHTITKEEKAFLEAFKIPHSKYIKRDSGLWLHHGDAEMEIQRSMFPFIEEGEAWGVHDLLKLEVEE